jgi:hypothetical protein
MEWGRTWVSAGRFRCDVCKRRLPYTCVWVNYDTKQYRHLGCFMPEGFVPDASTEDENEHAARAERNQRRHGSWR